MIILLKASNCAAYDVIQAAFIGLFYSMQATVVFQTAKHKKSTTQYVCAMGPQRTMFVIEVYTDAPSRTRQELGTILKKSG